MLLLPFYDFCCFQSVAVNIVYKLQFFYKAHRFRAGSAYVHRTDGLRGRTDSSFGGGEQGKNQNSPNILLYTHLAIESWLFCDQWRLSVIPRRRSCNDFCSSHRTETWLKATTRSLRSPVFIRRRARRSRGPCMIWKKKTLYDDWRHSSSNMPILAH